MHDNPAILLLESENPLLIDQPEDTTCMSLDLGQLGAMIKSRTAEGHLRFFREET
jgi:hypothetical protein